MRWAMPVILQVEPATLQAAHASAAESQAVAVLGAFQGNNTRAARMLVGTWQCPSLTFVRAVPENLTVRLSHRAQRARHERDLAFCVHCGPNLSRGAMSAADIVSY